jgi:hypothetical protein
MPDDVQAQERRKQAALRRLGTEHPQCVTCGEADWRCLELHHLANRAYDDTLVIVCRNCHRKVSDPSANSQAPLDPPLLERIGQLLLGLALFLAELLLPKLRAVGAELLEAAQHCPRPWGWSPAAKNGE